MAARPPSPVRVHAARIVREVVRRGAEVPSLLAARERDLAAPDRDLLREIVFGVLRNRSALDAELASVSRAPLERLAPDLREILEVGLYQIRRLDRVPRVTQVDELNAFDHAPVFDVEARDDPFREHYAGTASSAARRSMAPV